MIFQLQRLTILEFFIARFIVTNYFNTIPTHSNIISGQVKKHSRSGTSSLPSCETAIFTSAKVVHFQKFL